MVPAVHLELRCTNTSQGVAGKIYVRSNRDIMGSILCPCYQVEKHNLIDGKESSVKTQYLIRILLCTSTANQHNF